MPTRIAGVSIPDSRLAREAAALVREAESDLLWNHSMRVFLFGALLGEQQGLRFDAELLFIGALFHDLGLVEGHRSPADRFEVDGANAARAFMRAHGLDGERVRVVWDAIALHTTPGIPEHKEPEVALVNAGVRYDVVGGGYTDLDDATRDDVTRRYPRRDFKASIIHAFAEGIRDKPWTAYGTINSDILQREVEGYERPDFARLILDSPFPATMP